LAIDGALLRTPDTPELREHFGSGNTPNDRQTPYPMLRLVALMNVCSHLILDAQLSPRQSRRPAVSGTLGNRAGLPGYQEFSATECDDLRSKAKELIYQEVWGLLLAYNIIRREASQAAVALGRSPCDIRFKPVAQYIAVQLIVMAAANPISATGRRLSELRAGIGGLFLDHRPRPSRPRTVKISKTRYPVDRKAAPLK